ncbi:MAG: heme-binding domain-containing protein [Cyclobacteriaceae bacterium]|nr:heme-binding domain-containing protein [Cyclobacteriaceae bacterium]
MKKPALLIIASLFVMAGFAQLTFLNVREASESTAVKIPKKVQAVIDKSCFGCHSENGKSDKVKEALRWDKLNEYDKTKLVSAFDEIIEVIEKKEMPPEKYLANNPDSKPTDEEYKILLDWAEKEADKLIK